MDLTPHLYFVVFLIVWMAVITGVVVAIERLLQRFGFARTSPAEQGDHNVMPIVRDD